jgi:hypothetical protein
MLSKAGHRLKIRDKGPSPPLEQTAEASYAPRTASVFLTWSSGANWLLNDSTTLPSASITEDDHAGGRSARGGGITGGAG